MIDAIEWIYIAFAALWVGRLCYWWGSRLYEYAKGTSKKVEKSDHGLKDLLMIVALLFLITSFNGQLQEIYRCFIGFVIAAAGIMFAIWARRYLGSNWSGGAKLKKGQTLVKTGPYAIVRHPIYTGLSVGIIGTAIAVGKYQSIISIVCILLFSWMRITAEEKLLTERFGKEYDQYKKEVKFAFIPGLR